jgi:predicted RNA-binding protein associated with RNAse of E/G family
LQALDVDERVDALAAGLIDDTPARTAARYAKAPSGLRKGGRVGPRAAVEPVVA